MTTHVPDHSTSRRSVAAWVLWDVGSSSFGTIMMTFIFTVYLTSSYFGSPESASAILSWGLTVSGVCIAFFAPVSGQRADKSGRGIFWLGINTFGLVLLSALCFFVEPDPAHLWIGVILLSAANIFSEFAAVNYNAVLPRVSTPNNIGKISGIGWSAGYVGGLVALIIVLWAFIFEPNGLHVSTDDALNIRSVALFSALWSLVFCTPILIRMRRRRRMLPEVLPTRELKFLERGLSRLSPARQGGLFASYKELWRTIIRLRKTAPQTLYFLCASAIFRDGLAGIFTFGGVLAAGSFGFSTTDVIIFGVAANGVAAIGAVLGGYLDDYFGPKKIIIFSLSSLLITAVPLLLFPYPLTFWICALILALFVGPAQSSARTFLARIADPGTEGELFGLYSTTGRATSFLSPMLFGLFVTIFNAQVWGILGIMVVVLAGLLLALPLESPQALRLRQARRAEKKAAKAAQQ